MKNNIVNFIKKNYSIIVPLLVFFTGFVTINYLCGWKVDDPNFLKAFDVYPDGLTLSNLFDYLGNRFLTWTSRYTISILEVTMVRIPNAFRFFNSVIGVIVIFYIYKMFNSRSLFVNLFLALSFFGIDIGIIYDAGLVATSVNYLWPFACALPALNIIWDTLFHKRAIPLSKYIVSLLLLIILTLWQEVFALALFVLCLSLLIYYFSNTRKINKYFLIITILSLSFIIVSLVCPGNKLRTQYEIEHTFPQWVNMTFFDKICLSVVHTTRDFMYPINIIFSVVVIIVTFLQNKTIIIKINSFVPLCANILYTILFSTNLKNVPSISSIYHSYFSSYNPNWIGLLTGLIFIISFIISVVSLEKSFSKKIIIGISLISGLVSKAVIGFTASAFVFRYRTFMFLLFILLILMVVYLKQIENRFRELRPNVACKKTDINKKDNS